MSNVTEPQILVVAEGECEILLQLMDQALLAVQES
jgi:hypothetical protein